MDRGERTPHDGKISVTREGRRERKDEERDQKRGREKWRVSGREEEFVRSSHNEKFFVASKESRTREEEKVRERL